MWEKGEEGFWGASGSELNCANNRLTDCKCGEHLLNDQQRPQFTRSVSEAPTVVHESLNAGKSSHRRRNKQEELLQEKLRTYCCKDGV